MTIRLAVAIAAIGLLAACGSESADPGSSSDSLPTGSMTSGESPGGTGDVTSLAEIAGTYEATSTETSPKPIVAGSTITLRIEGDQFMMNAGCNTMSGSASVTDSHLSAPGLAMTEMGCAQDLMAQDAWLSEYLINLPKLQRNGPLLVLEWDDGSLQFAPTKTTPPEPAPADPDAPVSNDGSTGSSTGDGTGSDGGGSEPFDPDADGETAPADPGTSPTT